MYPFYIFDYLLESTITIWKYFLFLFLPMVMETTQNVFIFLNHFLGGEISLAKNVCYSTWF